MRQLARLRDIRGATLTAGLLLAVIGIAQIVDRLQQPTLAEATAFTVAPAGAAVPRLSPITVTFERAPTERVPQKLLQLAPTTPGTYAWLSPRTVLFQPDFPGLLRGSIYSVHVVAQPDAGLTKDVTATFTVADALTVQQIIPGPGDTEVPIAAPIIVQFSRSVAPLTTLGAQPTGSVVAFDPPLHGVGEWLNTSIYRFTPSDLAPSTTYRLRIAKGLSSAVDGVLRDDVVSSFTTVAPAVAKVTPDDNTQFASPEQEVTVTFNQPMDRSAAAGMGVRTAAGAAVPVRIEWSAGDTVATLRPSIRLAAQTVYLVTVDRGLRGARGGATAAPRTTSFSTIPPPSIARTSPADRDANAGRFGVTIQFATPMDPASLDGKASIDGFSAADLEGRVFTSEQFVSINMAFKPSTRYVVRFASGATDRYGQPMRGYEFAFTTGALPSSVSLALPAGSTAATYSASAEPVLYFQVTNQPAVAFSLYPLTADEGRRMLHDPSQANNRSVVPSLPVLRTWTEKAPAATNTTILASTSLSGGGPLPRGYYFLRTDGQFASQFAFAVVDTVIVVKLSTNELLAWAVDHDSGAPLTGVPVRATGPGLTPDTMLTDANGLASFSVPSPTPGKGIDRSYLAWVDSGGRTGVMSTRWGWSTAPYQFGLSADSFVRQWVGYVYMDRPIYRPGETTELKGVIRADDDAQYSLPPVGSSFQLVIGNPRGQVANTQTVTTNEFGTFAARFTVPSDAPLGSYFVNVQVPGGGASAYSIAGNTFLVAEFRAPEFQVEVAADRGAYVNGDTIATRTAASFFFGGALAGMPVQWSALASPFALQVKGYERYAFNDVDASRQSVFSNPLRATGSTTTGPDGIASYAIAAVLQAAEGAQRFTLSATVTDENGQAVAGSTVVTVHPATLYVGVHPAQYVASAGRDAAIDLVTVDANGATVGGRTVRVLVYDRQWITTKVQVPGGGRQYQSQPKDTLLQTLSATTDPDARASARIRPTKPGTLRIVAEVTDARGRVNRSATYLWVSGSGVASWQATNDDTMKLVADREQYAVGDTAEILVPAPFAGATALVTVERGKLISRTVRQLPTNSERLSIPITDRSVPDIFVSVVLYRGPTAADPVPRFKVGYVQLSVSTESRVLTVRITPDRAQAKPGDVVRYAVRVTDRTGAGVRSEVSVSVVDKAVLSLQEERGPDGLRAFWFERGVGVSTASSMAISANRWNDVVADALQGGKGGAGAGGGQPTDRTRRDFRNTAYWSAQVTTAPDGTASVDVTMPDNLTTWRMQVRAVSGDTMVGEGTNELLSTQPLLLRSALPRFLRVGDTADLRVLVRNATAVASTVRVTLAAEGVTVNGDLARTVSVAPDQSVVVAWPAKVTQEGTAKLTFTATGTGDLSDSLAQQLPVVLDMTPETVATGGIVTTDGAQEAVYLPPFANTAHGSLGVQVRSALVGSMAGELRSLEPITGEGAERVASRLIASIGVRRAERTAGASSVDDRRIASDLAGLVGRQRPDGGWAWCDQPLCTTDPNVTGWVLLALGEARRDGLSYDSGVAARAAAYVTAYVNRVTDVAAPADVSQKAFLLAALSSSGASGAAVTPARALFEQQRAQLPSSGRSAVLLTLADGGVAAEDPQVRALLNDLAAATIASANGNHWEDGARRAAFVSDTGVTALGVLALTRIQPSHALLPQTVRWLVLARAAERWHSSIDRALGILALSSYAARTGELGGDFSYQVLLDDKAVLAGLVRKDAAPVSAERDLPLATLTPGTASRLAFTRDYNRPGRLYYSVNLRYLTPAKDIDALNRGFAISHRYTLLDDPTKPVTAASVGDTVRVTVTVIAPADRNYVVIEDLLPAGLEPVDARLRTIDPALKVKLDADRLQAAQRQAGGYVAPWFGWYYSPWQQADLRDDRAVLSADHLPKGVYEYVYYARATAPGDFFVAPAHAEETYFPEVFGRSDSSRFLVKP
jgi:uncharacterized protein YfaS (alpha-2-macroglobulin family)